LQNRKRLLPAPEVESENPKTTQSASKPVRVEKKTLDEERAKTDFLEKKDRPIDDRDVSCMTVYSMCFGKFQCNIGVKVAHFNT
jgi:hypothetical protein